MPRTETDLDSPTTLVVAWRAGRSAQGRNLKAGGDVIASLKSYAAATLETVQGNVGRPYDPNDEQDDECSYLETTREELLDTALLDQILLGAALPQAKTADLRGHSLALYALVVGADPRRLTAFVRRNNPVQLATKSLVAIFDQTLTRVQQPLLAFDSRYDVVIHPSTVHILHQKNFELLFKESEAVLARTTEWAERLSTALPITGAGTEWLAKRLRETSVMRRRVRSILDSDYLPKLTPDVIRSRMEVHGLDPRKLMDDNGLVINKDTERDILLFLNEDLWTGEFSGQQYAASRKSRR